LIVSWSHIPNKAEPRADRIRQRAALRHSVAAVDDVMFAVELCGAVTWMASLQQSAKAASLAKLRLTCRNVLLAPKSDHLLRRREMRLVPLTTEIPDPERIRAALINTDLSLNRCHVLAAQQQRR
jgi:hypothetical protein